MLKGAIVGFGEVARHGHWPAYRMTPGLSIVAIVEQRPDRCRMAEDLDPGLSAFASLDALADSATAIDFVDICTPPALHASGVLFAVNRGWHVLCEKPFLLDPAVVEIARARALEKGLALVPVQNWKYAPILRRATALLRAGAIGRLRRAEIDTRRSLARAAGDAGHADWRHDPTIAGGGILMDHGWHALYLVLHWFGETPVDIQAVLQRPSPCAVEDEASAVVSFPSGEAVIALTWNAAARRNTMRLEGDQGEIVVEDDRLIVRSAGRSAIEQFAAPLSSGSHHADWFAAMFPDVAASFENPGAAHAGVDEAATCLSVIRRAYQADAAAAFARVP
jgi:predicted dehydrogenase